MWIIKKPRKIIVDCDFCGAKLKVSGTDWRKAGYDRDIHSNELTSNIYVRCPFCLDKIIVFKSEADEKC